MGKAYAFSTTEEKEGSVDKISGQQSAGNDLVTEIIEGSWNASRRQHVGLGFERSQHRDWQRTWSMIGREEWEGNSWNRTRACNNLEIIKSSCKELPTLRPKVLKRTKKP